MGTPSTTKPLKNVAGLATEFATLTTSAGSADANALPALNGAGVLDLSITNGTVTSAGAGSANKLVALDSSGKLDVTTMPLGIGADTATITTSEALTAGDFVNIWDSTGAKARKADATVSGKHAHGFVLTGFGSGTAATIYFEGTNTSVTGQTPGDVFLATTAGLATTTAPNGSGNAVQPIGIATSATSINFQYNRPTILI